MTLPETIRPTYGAGYYLLHRADLHTSLADAVREKDANAINLNHRLTGIHQIADDRVEIRFANGHVVVGVAVIGADGAVSATRTRVFGDQEVNYTGRVAYRALLPAADVPPAVAKDPYRLFVGPCRSFLHYPLRGGDVMNVIGNADEHERFYLRAAQLTTEKDNRKGYLHEMEILDSRSMEHSIRSNCRPSSPHSAVGSQHRARGPNMTRPA